MSKSGAAASLPPYIPSSAAAGNLKPEQKVDVHGVSRAKCNNCTECPQFVSLPGHILCAYCGCPPARHSKSTQEILQLPTGVPGLDEATSSSSSLSCQCSCPNPTNRRVSESLTEQDSDQSSFSSSDSESEDISDTESLSSSSSGVSSYASGQDRRHRSWRADWASAHAPDRIERLLEQLPVDRDTRMEHAWNPADCSPNIKVLEDDPFTFSRNPVYKSTDCIRTRKGYTDGLHIFEVRWPTDIRGTHPVVGVATSSCPLSERGYKRLVGSNKDSWGWCIKSKNLFHDSRKFRNGVPYPSNVGDRVKVPSWFYMILDMDKGTLSYQVGDDYLGVAFSGLRGRQLYPIVSAVWGNCEVTMRYIGSLEPAAAVAGGDAIDDGDLIV